MYKITPETEQNIIKQYNDNVKISVIMVSNDLKSNLYVYETLKKHNIALRRTVKKLAPIKEEHATTGLAVKRVEQKYECNLGLLKQGDTKRNSPAVLDVKYLNLPVWNEKWASDVKVAWLHCWDNERQRISNKEKGVLENNETKF